MQGGTRYYSINEYLRSEFGCKTIKLSIEGGFTCPNRDGTLGTGGCAFCSAGGSGELASSVDEQIELLRGKWPNAKYIAYFQSHTNTYGSADMLRGKYFAALDNPLISGIAISTRPDCVGGEVVELLSEINRNHFMWVELGLQTIHADTQRAMNLCYTTEQFRDAASALKAESIRTVVHLILGLPDETEEDMLESLQYVVSEEVFGIKLHLFNLVKGSPLAAEMPDYTPFDSMESYVDLVVRMLERIPPDITIHRLTGDVPRQLLLSPEWSYKKRTILNAINRELEIRDTKQGSALL